MTPKWLHNYPFCAAVGSSAGGSEREEEGGLPKAQHLLGFSMYIRFFRGNYTSQDGNLKSGHGETDWNIQSYLFDTRVSYVEIFQVGVLQETFSALIGGVAAHISWQDWNNWRIGDLSLWNYVFTRSSSSLHTHIRSRFFFFFQI